MTPDELQAQSHERALAVCFESPCTTCEDEGAVVWFRSQDGSVTCPHEERLASALCRGWARHRPLPTGVDTCPECGRGREVGRL